MDLLTLTTSAPGKKDRSGAQMTLVAVSERCTCNVTQEICLGNLVLAFLDGVQDCAYIH